MIIKQLGPDSSKHRHNIRTKSSFYNSKAWRTTRNAFIKVNPYCAECGEKASVVDHKKQVILNGDKHDWNNLQSLCSSCHNAKSAREKNEMYRK